MIPRVSDPARSARSLGYVGAAAPNAWLTVALRPVRRAVGA